MKASPIRNLSLTLTILAVFAIAVVGYLYFYTQKREKYLHARNYRVIEQIGRNIQVLNKTYQQNARNNAARDINRLKRQALALFNEDRERINSRIGSWEQDARKTSSLIKMVTGQSLEREKVEKIPPFDLSMIGFDPEAGFQLNYRNNGAGLASELQEKWSSINTQTEDIDAQLGGFGFKFNMLVSPPRFELDTVLSLKEFESRYLGRINLAYRINCGEASEPGNAKGSSESHSQLVDRADGHWDLVYRGKLENGPDDGDCTYELTRSLDDFLQPVMRPEIFEEFVIFRPDTTGEEDNPLDFQMIFSTQYDNFYFRELGQALDTLLNQQLDPKKRHRVTGIPFKIYLQPLEMGEENLILSGLVDEDRFEKEKSQIPPVVVLVLGLVALIILLSFPTLKLLVMSKREQLGISDVLLSVTSILLVTSLMTLLIFDGYKFFIEDRQAEYQNLEELHREITQTFFDEVDSVFSQLSIYDSLMSESQLIKEHPDTALTEILKFDRSDFKPEVYPYFINVFRSTPQDSLGAELTVKVNPTPKVSIAGRKYLEQLKIGQGWDWQGDPQRQIMIESILTRTSGDRLAIVSKKGLSTPIIFMASQLYSVFKPVLPQGYGYCVIDETGMVQFHSDLTRNLQENFLQEADNDDFRSAIYTNKSLRASGTYLGVEHRFYMAPLGDLPLYLVTFRDRSFDRGAHAQAITLTFFLVVLFFIAGLLFWGLMYVLRPGRQVLRQSYFLLDWLRPNYQKASQYRRLILANLLLLLLMVIFGLDTNAVEALSLIVLANYLALAMAFLTLNRDTYYRFIWKHQQKLVSALGVIFFLLNLMIYGPLGVTLNSGVFIFELVGLGLVYLVVDIPYRPEQHKRFFLTRFFNRILKFNWLKRPLDPLKPVLIRARSSLFSALSPHLSYRYVFLSWFLVSSIYPVVKYFQVSYDHERHLLVRRAQMELVRQLEDREEWLKIGYRDIEPGDDFLSRRNQKAIYSMCNNQTQVINDPEVRYVFTARKPLDTLLNLSLINRMVILQGTDTLFTYGNLASPDSLSRGIISKPQVFRNGYSIPVLEESMVFISDSNLLEFALDHGALIERKDSMEFWRELRKSNFPFIKTDSSLRFALVYTDTVQKKVEGELDSLYVEGSLAYYQRLAGFNSRKRSNAEKEFYRFLAFLRQEYNEVTRETNRINQGVAAGRSSWMRQGDIIDFYDRRSGVLISSILPTYQVPTPLTGNLVNPALFFWVILFVFLYVVYKLIDFHINRLFAQELVATETLPPAFNKQLLQKSKENVLLVVPPYPISSDHLEVLGRRIPSEFEREQRDWVFNVRNLLTSKPENGQPNPAKALPQIYGPFMVLDHFEEVLTSPQACALIMDFVTRLVRANPDKQVILVSTESDLDIETILKGENEENTPDEETRRQQGRWQRTLSGFVKVVYPLDFFTFLHNDKELRAFIAEDCCFLRVARFPSQEVDHVHGQLDYSSSRIQVKGLDIEDVNWLLIDRDDDIFSLNEKREIFESEYDRGKRISIFSKISPVALLQVYDAAYNRPKQFLTLRSIPKGEDLTPSLFDLCGERRKLWTRSGVQTFILENKQAWRRVLSGITNKGLVLLNNPMADNKERVRDRIMMECAQDAYLQGIEEELMQQFGDGKVSEDEVISTIEKRAQLHYQAIWKSCTEDEHFMIYDLARDGLVNAKDRETFASLVRKGIIITTNDSPKLMSKSFRNYVLGSIKPEKLREMQRSIRLEGTWSRLRVPITILIFALTAFILVTQKEFLDDTTAFLTGFAALAAVVRQVLVNFSSTSFNLKDTMTFNPFKRGTSTKTPKSK